MRTAPALERRTKDIKEAVYGLEGISRMLHDVDVDSEDFNDYTHGCLVSGVEAIAKLIQAKVYEIEEIAGIKSDQI